MSPASRAALYDSERVAPFANLRTDTGLIKRHGIIGATANLDGGTTARSPIRSRQRAPRTAPAPPAATSRTVPRTGHVGDGREVCQRVTARDLDAGQLRFPRAAKRLFPAERQYVDVDVRRRDMRARWDPRVGPDRERSGVLAFGRGALTGLVAAGDVLAVGLDGGRVVLE
ncbi:MAG: hypothetical protein ACXVHB_26810 [Solirubrobacteraceae bacterium]